VCLTLVNLGYSILICLKTIGRPQQPAVSISLSKINSIELLFWDRHNHQSMEGAWTSARQNIQHVALENLRKLIKTASSLEIQHLEMIVSAQPTTTMKTKTMMQNRSHIQGRFGYNLNRNWILIKKRKEKIPTKSKSPLFTNTKWMIVTPDNFSVKIQKETRIFFNSLQKRLKTSTSKRTTLNNKSRMTITMMLILSHLFSWERSLTTTTMLMLQLQSAALVIYRKRFVWPKRRLPTFWTATWKLKRCLRWGNDLFLP